MANATWGDAVATWGDTAFSWDGTPIVPGDITASVEFNAPAAVFEATALINSAPAVNAGPDQTVDLPTLTATMDGTVSDDGFPDPPAALTIEWTKISGPSTVVFADDTDPDTLVTFGAAGVYRLQLSVDDGEFVSTDIVRIWIRDPAASSGRTRTGRPVDGFGYGFNFGY